MFLRNEKVCRVETVRKCICKEYDQKMKTMLGISMPRGQALMLIEIGAASRFSPFAFPPFFASGKEDTLV